MLHPSPFDKAIYFIRNQQSAFVASNDSSVPICPDPNRHFRKGFCVENIVQNRV